MTETSTAATISTPGRLQGRHDRQALPRLRGEDRRGRRDPGQGPQRLPGLLQERGGDARDDRRRLAAHRRHRRDRRGRLHQDHRPQEGHHHHRRRQEHHPRQPRERDQAASHWSPSASSSATASPTSSPWSPSTPKTPSPTPRSTACPRTPRSWPTNAEVVEAIEAHVAKINEKFARVEQVKKIAILPRDLSQESGELTPTLKVKRAVVAASTSARSSSSTRAERRSRRGFKPCLQVVASRNK